VGGRAALVNIEDDLRQSVTIAKVDDEELAVVAVVMDPTGEPDLMPLVGFAELSAGVRAIACLDVFHVRIRFVV
jgi:hypothetical protein